MRRGLLVLVVALALAVGVYGQTTPQILFEHDGVNLTTFKCVVDGGAAVDLGKPTPTGTTYSVDITTCTPLMVNGSHRLVIQACNGTVCTDAAAITVVKL